MDPKANPVTPSSAEWDVALGAVEAAARICAKVQAAISPETLVKRDRSPVTVADYASQAVICRRLQAAFPADRILAEEHSLDLLEGKTPGMAAALIDLLQGEQPGATLDDVCRWIDFGCEAPAGARTWILDPIDGTKGFLRKEQYAIALALMVDGRMELGLLGCPNIAYDDNRTGCLFIAARGQGAHQLWLGDLSVSKPIGVSSDAGGASLRFVESVEAEHADHGTHHALCAELGSTIPAVRMDSQAKYAIVARGEASAYLRLQPDPAYRQKVWDHAAGCVIIEEAGGTVTDAAGRPLDFTCGSMLDRNVGVVATNSACHRALLAAIATVAPHS